MTSFWCSASSLSISCAAEVGNHQRNHQRHQEHWWYHSTSLLRPYNNFIFLRVLQCLIFECSVRCSTVNMGSRGCCMWRDIFVDRNLVQIWRTRDFWRFQGNSARNSIDCLEMLGNDVAKKKLKPIILMNCSHPFMLTFFVMFVLIVTQCMFIWKQNARSQLGRNFKIMFVGWNCYICMQERTSKLPGM